jgi:hypothetical protein
MPRDKGQPLEIPAGCRFIEIQFGGKTVGFVFDGIGYVGTKEAKWPPNFLRDMGIE